MAVHTTRDILDQARYFHRQLKAFYDALHDQIDQPKVQLIIDYLSQHEQRMEDALAAYEDDIAARVADTWFKYTPAVSIDEAIRGIAAKPGMTLDELMCVAVQLENHFVTLYEHARDQAVSGDVKAVFEHLLAETIKERLKLSRDIVDMQDLL